MLANDGADEMCRLFYGHSNKIGIAHVFFTFEEHIWCWELLQMEILFERSNRIEKKMKFDIDMIQYGRNS